MEALNSVSMKIFTNTALPSSKALPSKPEIHFLLTQKTPLSFSHSISLDRKALPFQAASTATNVATDIETAETRIQATQPAKSAHVKFQLERECSFGESFLLVGDHSMFGSWNPSNAIPLDWSEGDMWTAELDVPIEKPVEFKFILKQSTGDLLWQPDPDRVFWAWETKNTIIIAEDWENAKVQKITEEGLTPNPDMEPVNAANVSHSMANGAKELITTEYIPFPGEEPKETYSADRVVGFEKEVLMSKNGSRTSTDKNPASAEDKTTLFTSEEGPVLVPGMTPLKAMSTEETLSEESVKSIIGDASVGVDAASDLNMLEAAV